MSVHLQADPPSRLRLGIDLIHELALAGLSAFLVLAPWLPAGSLGHHNLARAFELALLPLMALALLVQPGGQAHRRRWAPAFWLALSAMALFSCARSAQPAIALRELALWSGLVCVVGVTAQGARHYGLHRLVLVAVAAAALYASVQMLIYLLAMLQGERLDTWVLALGYENPRFMNHVQTVVLALLAGAAGSSALPRAWRWLAWWALIAGGAMLVATLGRATLLALLSAAVFVAVACGPRGRAYLMRLAVAAALAVLLHGLLFVVLAAHAGEVGAVRPELAAEAGSDHSRFYLWRIALDFIKQQPWLGVGPMHYAHYPNLKGAHPHNIYLQIGAEFGLPMLALMLAGLVRVLEVKARALRRRPELPNAEIAIAALAALVAALVDGMFSGNFVMPNSQVWIAFAAGLAIAGAQPTALPEEQAASAVWRSWRQLAYGGLLALLVWLNAVAWPELASPEPRLGGREQSLQLGSTARPRFWLDGWF